MAPRSSPARSLRAAPPARSSSPRLVADEQPSTERGKAATSLRAPDGARVELTDGALDFLDPQGRILIRYRDGKALIINRSGNLLVVPAARVL